MPARKSRYRASIWSRPRQRAIALAVCAAMFATVMGIASVLDPMMAITAFIGIVAIGSFLPRGEIAVAAFAASTFFEVVSANVGLSVTPVKLLGGVVVLTALLMMLTRSKERPPSAWRHHPFLVTASLMLLGWAMASVAWAVDVSQVKSLAMRLVLDVVVMLSVPLLVRRSQDLRTFGWWIIGAAIAGATMGIVVGSNLYGRLTGMFADPNEFASATVAAAVFGLALGESSPRRSVTWIGRFAAAGLFVTVAMSASRTGIIAAAVAFLVLMLTARGIERIRLTGLLATTVAVAIAWLVMTPSGALMMERLTGENSTGRTDLWRVARYQFQDKPVTGVGLGNYPVVSKEYLTRDVQNIDLFIRDPRTVHNTPLELLAELGIVGFVTFYALVAGFLLVGRRNLVLARRLGDGSLIGACRGIMAATWALLVSSLTLSALYVELQWVLFGAIVATASILRTRLAAAEGSEALLLLEPDQQLLEDDAILLEPADDAALLAG